MQKKIEIFTDGSCLGNPGPGGYGVILRYKNYIKEFSAGYRLTTNNRMELMAAIIALEQLKKPCEITFNTDSKYLILGIKYWINYWKSNNWKNIKKKIVKNSDLWKRLDTALQTHHLEWNWLKSHNKHPENERCDKLAKNAATYKIIYEDL